MSALADRRAQIIMWPVIDAERGFRMFTNIVWATDGSNHAAEELVTES